MVYNRIQLFALNVPDRISLPFELYALEVPQHWKELFNRLQQHKLGRSPVLPPIKCLNQYLQLLVEDLLFPNRFAFSPKSNSKIKFDFRESISANSSSSEVISWAPEFIVRGKEKKTTHYYSYHATFKLDYHPGGVPYLNCDYQGGFIQEKKNAKVLVLSLQTP
jgi:hypothetical protein